MSEFIELFDPEKVKIAVLYFILGMTTGWYFTYIAMRKK